MSDYAIKKALEVARNVLAEGNCHGPCPEGEPCMCRLDTVATIAAFHDRMEAHWREDRGEPCRADTHAALATAIRRAGGAA